MLKKTVFAILAIVSVTVLLLPTNGWINPDCTSNLLFERYGPRAENLLIHMHSNKQNEFAALKAGQIDICDSPLSMQEYQIMTSPPYDQTLKVVNYGAEYGLYILDLNSNNNTYLGNPPNPAYPNPVLADGRNWMADVWLRRALGYLIDRPSLVLAIGAGFAYPLYTTIHPGLAKYALDIYGDPTIPWAWKYDPVACNATLYEHGYPIGPSGKREYRGDVVKLKIYINAMDGVRTEISDMFLLEMMRQGFDLSDVHLVASSTAYLEVMLNKDFHIYIGSWTLGLNPDYLTYWDWDYYWHPGYCYNYGGHNDPAFNDAVDALMYCNTQPEAVYCAEVAQYRQALMMLSAPLLCLAGNKAYSRWNVGSYPWDNTENQNWLDTVNVQGYGVDNYWTLMNWHTNVTPCDNGMTIDYGLWEPAFSLVNPIYTIFPSDWKMLSSIYDSLLARNASDMNQFVNWMTKQFSVGLYIHPVYGLCSKVRITLKPDLYWSDGTPLTTADIYFTFVELKQILRNRGFPKPASLWRNVQDILSFKTFDPFNFEVLLDVKSYWALDWIGSQIILPKHIWKPIALTGDPTADYRAHPEVLIGSGPWKLITYDEPAGLAQLSPNTLFHNYVPVLTNFKNNEDYRIRFRPVDGLDPVVVTLENLNIRTPVTYNFTFTVIFPDGTITNKIHDVNVALEADAKTTYNLPWIWVYGKYEESYILQVTSEGQGYTETAKWIKYVTIPEDIIGSNWYTDIGLPGYPYKAELKTSDIKVDIQDVAKVAGAFGSYPGHPKWNPQADINGDYKVDIGDLARIGKQFGWHG